MTGPRIFRRRMGPGLAPGVVLLLGLLAPGPVAAASAWRFRFYLGASLGAGATVQAMDWKTVYQEPLRGEPRQDLNTGWLGGVAVEWNMTGAVALGLDLRYETASADRVAELAVPHPFYFDAYRPTAAARHPARIHQAGAMLYLRVDLAGPVFVTGGPRLDLWSLPVVDDVTLAESAYPYDDPPQVTLHTTTLRRTAVSGELGLGLQTRWRHRGNLYLLVLYRIAAPRLTGPHQESVRVRPQRLRLTVGVVF